MDILEFKDIFPQKPYFFVYDLSVWLGEWEIDYILKSAGKHADGVFLKTFFGNHTDQELIEYREQLRSRNPDLLVGLCFHQHPKWKKTTQVVLENGYDLVWGFDANDPRPEESRSQGLYVGELREPVWNDDKTHKWAKKIAKKEGIYSLELRDYDGDKYVPDFDRFGEICAAIGISPLFLSDCVTAAKVKWCLPIIDGMIDTLHDRYDRNSARGYISQRRVREMSRILHGSA